MWLRLKQHPTTPACGPTAKPPQIRICGLAPRGVCISDPPQAVRNPADQPKPSYPPPKSCLLGVLTSSPSLRTRISTLQASGLGGHDLCELCEALLRWSGFVLQVPSFLQLYVSMKETLDLTTSCIETPQSLHRMPNSINRHLASPPPCRMRGEQHRMSWKTAVGHQSGQACML